MQFIVTNNLIDIYYLRFLTHFRLFTSTIWHTVFPVRVFFKEKHAYESNK